MCTCNAIQWNVTPSLPPSTHPPLQFTGNAFGLSFLLLLMVSLAMTAFGFFVAAFLRKVRGWWAFFSFTCLHAGLL